METPLIQVNKLSVRQKEKNVLEQVTFTLNKGEFAYLIGKTGSGKSSLMKTLYAELPPFEGEVEVCGYNMNAIKKQEVPFLRRKIGIVFQDFQLLTDRNVRDNLRFVLRATGWNNDVEIDQRIDEVLGLVGMSGHLEKMPFNMSGGEQQRIAVARALLNKPELILADEPTGNLDPDTSLEIMKLMMDIANSGTAILMATHDYYMIEKFPARLLKVENGLVMDLGRILFE